MFAYHHVGDEQRHQLQYRTLAKSPWWTLVSSSICVCFLSSLLITLIMGVKRGNTLTHGLAQLPSFRSSGMQDIWLPHMHPLPSHSAVTVYVVISAFVDSED